MVLLHHEGGNENSVKDLARRIQRKLPECLFLLLRGPETYPKGNNGYHWAYSENGVDDRFIRSSRHLLKDIILDDLVKGCFFRPRNIVILGHGQGSLVGLTAATIWNDTELGGVIAVGGSLPADFQLLAPVKAKTPALMIKASHGLITPESIELLKESFLFVDVRERPGSDEDVPKGQEQDFQPYLSFLVHRLRRDEWNKHAVVSFGRCWTLVSTTFN